MSDPRFHQHLNSDYRSRRHGYWVCGHQRSEVSNVLHHVILYGVAYEVCCASGAQRVHDPIFVKDNGPGRHAQNSRQPSEHEDGYLACIT
jgi:hypothetical protein